MTLDPVMSAERTRRLVDDLRAKPAETTWIEFKENNADGPLIGKLISARRVERVVTSHIGTNPETQRQMLSQDLVVELVPQGTLAERIRAGGHGLGGVLTPTGVGTLVEQLSDIWGTSFLVCTTFW